MYTVTNLQPLHFNPFSLPQTPLPQQLITDIQRWTAAYGKLKLVLKRSRYSLESAVPEIIQKLLSDTEILSCRASEIGQGQDQSQGQGQNQTQGLDGRIQGTRTTLTGGIEIVPAAKRAGLVIPGTEQARKQREGGGGGDMGLGADAGTGRERDDLLGAVIGIDRGGWCFWYPVENSPILKLLRSSADEMDDEDRVQSFEIDGTKMEVSYVQSKWSQAAFIDIDLHPS